jgi:hypothetical protein
MLPFSTAARPMTEATTGQQSWPTGFQYFLRRRDVFGFASSRKR